MKIIQLQNLIKNTNHEPNVYYIDTPILGLTKVKVNHKNFRKYDNVENYIFEYKDIIIAHLGILIFYEIPGVKNLKLSIKIECTDTNNSKLLNDFKRFTEYLMFIKKERNLFLSINTNTLLSYFIKYKFSIKHNETIKIVKKRNLNEYNKTKKISEILYNLKHHKNV